MSPCGRDAETEGDNEWTQRWGGGPWAATAVADGTPGRVVLNAAPSCFSFSLNLTKQIYLSFWFSVLNKQLQLYSKVIQLYICIYIYECTYIHSLFYMLFYYGLLQDIEYSGLSVVKNLLANAGDMGSIPRSGRSLGEGNGKPLQYS